MDSPRLLFACDLNPYFEHKKMNPNFNLFTGSAKVHLGGTDLNPIEHLIFWTFNIYVVYINLQNIFQSESEKVHNLCLGQF